ncbi:MAG: hypothetical protein KAS39_08135, partial [Actinomycetia bacterium]|nr:hypothetical protein [Actinomycetes bacterium]
DSIIEIDLKDNGKPRQIRIVKTAGISDIDKLIIEDATTWKFILDMSLIPAEDETDIEPEPETVESDIEKESKPAPVQNERYRFVKEGGSSKENDKDEDFGDYEEDAEEEIYKTIKIFYKIGLVSVQQE